MHPENETTTLMNLPNEILIEIFKYLDIPSRFKMRLNKRLNQLQLSVPNIINEIGVNVSSHNLTVKWNSHGRRKIPLNDCTYSGFRRLSLNSSSKMVELFMGDEGETTQYLDLLLEFSPVWFYINNCMGKRLSSMTLTCLLIFAQKAEYVYIQPTCNSLTVHDLCELRKFMLSGDCRLKEFHVEMEKGMQKAFVKRCFNVTIEDEYEPRRTRVYRTDDESIEIYSYQSPLQSLDLVHFEGNLCTTFSDFTHFAFKVCQSVDKPEEKYKIRLNHLYM